MYRDVAAKVIPCEARPRILLVYGFAAKRHNGPQMSSTPRRITAPAAAPFGGTKRFEIVRVLGEGGMGIVYEAFDRDREMPVALKTLRWVDAQSIFRLEDRVSRARGSRASQPRAPRRAASRGGSLVLHDGARQGRRASSSGSRRRQTRDDDATCSSTSAGCARRCASSRPGSTRCITPASSHRDLKPSNVMVTARRARRAARLRPHRRRARARVGLDASSARPRTCRPSRRCRGRRGPRPIGTRSA